MTLINDMTGMQRAPATSSVLFCEISRHHTSTCIHQHVCTIVLHVTYTNAAEPAILFANMCVYRLRKSRNPTKLKTLNPKP